MKNIFRKFYSKRRKGYTLLELLVVIVILGVLVTISVATYNKLIRKSRVADGMHVLEMLANAEDKYFVEHGEYANRLGLLKAPIHKLIPGTDGSGSDYIVTTNFRYRKEYKDDCIKAVARHDGQYTLVKNYRTQTPISCVGDACANVADYVGAPVNLDDICPVAHECDLSQEKCGEEHFWPNLCICKCSHKEILACKGRPNPDTCDCDKIDPNNPDEVCGEVGQIIQGTCTYGKPCKYKILDYGADPKAADTGTPDTYSDTHNLYGLGCGIMRSCRVCKENGWETVETCVSKADYCKDKGQELDPKTCQCVGGPCSDIGATTNLVYTNDPCFYTGNIGGSGAKGASSDPNSVGTNSTTLGCGITANVQICEDVNGQLQWQNGKICVYKGDYCAENGLTLNPSTCECESSCGEPREEFVGYGGLNGEIENCNYVMNTGEISEYGASPKSADSGTPEIGGEILGTLMCGVKATYKVCEEGKPWAYKTKCVYKADYCATLGDGFQLNPDNCECEKECDTSSMPTACSTPVHSIEVCDPCENSTSVITELDDKGGAKGGTKSGTKGKTDVNNSVQLSSCCGYRNTTTTTVCNKQTGQWECVNNNTCTPVNSDEIGQPCDGLGTAGNQCGIKKYKDCRINDSFSGAEVVTSCVINADAGNECFDGAVRDKIDLSSGVTVHERCVSCQWDSNCVSPSGCDIANPICQPDDQRDCPDAPGLIQTCNDNCEWGECTVAENSGCGEEPEQNACCHQDYECVSLNGIYKWVKKGACVLNANAQCDPSSNNLSALGIESCNPTTCKASCKGNGRYYEGKCYEAVWNNLIGILVYGNYIGDKEYYRAYTGFCPLWDDTSYGGKGQWVPGQCCDLACQNNCFQELANGSVSNYHQCIEDNGGACSGSGANSAAGYSGTDSTCRLPHPSCDNLGGFSFSTINGRNCSEFCKGRNRGVCVDEYDVNGALSREPCDGVAPWQGYGAYWCRIAGTSCNGTSGCNNNTGNQQY